MYLWGEEIAILSEMASVHDSDASTIVELEVQRLLKVYQSQYAHYCCSSIDMCMFVVRVTGCNSMVLTFEVVTSD
jgi:hypothetical protein